MPHYQELNKKANGKSQQFVDLLKDELPELHELFEGKVGESKIRSQDFGNFYYQLFTLRKMFRSIANQVKRWNALDFMRPSSILFPFSAQLEVNLETGKAPLIARNDWLKMILSVDVRRLKICPVCRGLFWREELKKLACSEQCANTRRKRRAREAEKAEKKAYEETTGRKLLERRK